MKKPGKKIARGLDWIWAQARADFEAAPPGRKLTKRWIGCAAP